jgi:polysaccharide chain length determinant protein (PEP-CTERM system associated)
MEPLEEQESTGLDLEQYLAVIKRRRWLILIPLFVGWVLVWTASWVMPPTYRSETTILVQAPSMPKDYVMPNVTDDLQARLQSLTQQILSRTRLIHIIESMNLYQQERKRSSPDEVVEQMRKDIQVDLVKDQAKVTAFTVSYSSRDPHVAQEVVSELTNLFISENLEVRQQLSEDTTQFLQNQMEDARKSLADQEEKIRQFKAEHVNDLPDQVQSNLAVLSGLQAQMTNEEDSLNRAKQQSVYLQSLISQYRSMQSTHTTTADGGTQMGLPAIDQQLDKLKAQLTDLESRYTDKHPDVRKLKDQIAQTEQLRAKMLADQKNSSSSDPSTTVESADPRQGAAIADLQSQLKANQIEISNRERTIAGLQAKVNQYQGRLNDEPVREQQLADLSRGYEQSKANYDDLLKKKNSSELATNLERRQQGEHFQVLDPPSLPQKPDFPNRLKFAGAAFGIGLALGVVVAGAAEFLDGRLYSEGAIEKLLPVDIISEIPPIKTSEELRSDRKGNWLAWTATGVIGIVILFGSAVSFLRG